MESGLTASETRDPRDEGSCAKEEWLRLAVIQPSPFCNINCDYCYLPGRSETHRMDHETLRSVVREIFLSGLVSESLTFVWHAGEPLAVPILWYEKALDVIASEAPTGLRVIHSFQSNGTLINDRWCEFIKSRNISMGLSIDGPAWVHDAHRKTRQGQGTHELAMRGARTLQSHGISFHVIAVITEASLNHADEIFDFFVENGMARFGFNVEEQEGIHTESSLQECHVERVEAFFRTMFARQKSANGEVRIREFDFALQRIGVGRETAAMEFLYENEQVRPFGILSVDWQGHFSTFSPEMLGVSTKEYGNFTFGKIPDNTLLDGLRSDNFLHANAAIAAGVERCRQDCGYFKLCGGGAPANKYFENGSFDSTETAYCRHVIQLPINLVLENLEADLGNSRAL